MNEELRNKFSTFFEQDYPGIDEFVNNILNSIFTGRDSYRPLPVPEDYLTEDNRQRASECGILKLVKVGEINFGEGIEVFDITLSNEKRLRYNRVGIQQFVRSSLFPFTNAFMLFHNEDTIGEDWRFSYAYKQLTLASITSAKRFTYLFGKNHRARTASERFALLADSKKDTQALLDAFSVQKVSDDFFEEYRKKYSEFCDFLFENRNNIAYFGSEFSSWEDKYLRDYIKKMLGRITFIYFLQRKGWMNGDLNYMNNSFNRSSKKDNYLDAFLEPLFFGVLNTKPDQREQLFKKEGWDLSLLQEWTNVPYLNGGLFERDKQDEPLSRFPSEMFERLFEFYASYNFTIDENDPDDAEVGVDPEMLGKIFESLLEDNKDKGAFYTPKFIVDYMCQESLIAYLQTGITDEIRRDALRQFVETHDSGFVTRVGRDFAHQIDEKLSVVKICDPAIGSGAFPMGMLNLLVKCRESLNIEKTRVEFKREIIQNNIYGVDIEKGAIDIARLRFWLSLIVDEDTPQALPNLDYKIVEGNSLMTTFEDRFINLDTKGQQHFKVAEMKAEKRKLYQLKKEFYNASGDQKLEITISIKDTIIRLISMQLGYESRSWASKNAAQLELFELPHKMSFNDILPKLPEDTQRIIEHCNSLHQRLNDRTIPLHERSLTDIRFFDWRILFTEVFDNDNPGFDIVIGNPPYFVYEGSNKDELPILRKQNDYKIAFGGKLNAYKLFLACSLKKLIKKEGINSFIFQNSFMADQQAANLRKYVLTNCQILTIDSFPERDSRKKRVFENVKMSVCILLATNSSKNSRFKVNVWDDKYKSTGITTYFTKEEIETIDPDYLTIPRLREDAKPIVLKMICKRNKTIKCWEGELNVSSHRPFFSDDTSLPIIMKGAGIQRYYYTFDMSQGQIEHLKEKEYQKKYGKTEKAHHHEKERIVMQGMTGANDKIRLIMSLVPKGIYLGHSCKYIMPTAVISTRCLLGLLNSKLYNFFFRSFSTNSNVNGYEVEAIPICDMSDSYSELIEMYVNQIIEKKKVNHNTDTSVLENRIDYLIYRLYGLTYNEVLIVDPETPISKEKYESKLFSI